MAVELITVDDLRLAIAQAAIDDVDEADKLTAIRAASGELNTACGGRYPDGFTLVSPDLKLHLARAAVFHLMSLRGFNPAADDGLLERNYERALKYFREVGRGELNPSTTENVPLADEAPDVDSDDERGWGTDGV